MTVAPVMAISSTKLSPSVSYPRKSKTMAVTLFTACVLARFSLTMMLAAPSGAGSATS